MMLRLLKAMNTVITTGKATASMATKAMEARAMELKAMALKGTARKMRINSKKTIGVRQSHLKLRLRK